VCALGAADSDDEDDAEPPYGIALPSSSDSSSHDVSSFADSSASEGEPVSDEVTDESEVDELDVLALVGAVSAIAAASTAIDPVLTPVATMRLFRNRRARCAARRRRARAPGSCSLSAGSGVGASSSSMRPLDHSAM
jgi:hypothetical protein